MWDDLDGLAQVGALAFLGDDGVINLARSHIVGLGRVYAQETLIVAQVEVRLGAVFRDIALAVFVRVERTGIDVDVGIEFLDGDAQAACLQELGQRGRDDAFSE